MKQSQTNQNNAPLTTSHLRNGKSYTARFLQQGDIAKILQLQSKVKNALRSKANLEPLSQDEFTFILNGNGFMMGIFIAGNLVGFRAMLIPELDDEHLGLDCGLSKYNLSSVIYSEVSCVDPEFRGNGLQTILGELLFAQVDTDRFHYICATVSPNNVASIKDKLKLGMRIVALKEKYGGKMRYIMMKNLLQSEFTNEDVEDTAISIDHITAQQKRLQEGCYGVDIEERTGTWHVLYRNNKRDVTRTYK